MFDKEMEAALEADGEKLAALTGEDHGPYFDGPVNVTAVRFTYRNWRGEVAERTVLPIDITFSENPWHNGPQWFLNALDTDKRYARRSFAIQDILSPIQHVAPVNNRPTAAP